MLEAEIMRFDKYMMAQMNRKLLLELLFLHGPINRAELAKLSGLSIPTVMKIIDAFAEENLIRVVGKRESTGGRQPQLYEVAKDAYHSIGVDFGRNRTKIVVANLAGEICIRRSLPTGDTMPPQMLIDRVVALVREVKQEAEANGRVLLGIGLGMPGLINPESGRVVFSPDFGWSDVDLLQPFRQEFTCKVIIENANRAMALGERWFGLGREARDYLCVNLGYGIGSALVLDDELHRGASGSSGELGHITMEPNGPLCRCGNHGCLEAIASGYAIQEQAQQMIRAGRGKVILAQAENDLEAVDARCVFAAARSGDVEAETFLRSRLEYIGSALAGLINLIDPELVILEGGFTKSADVLMPILKEAVRTHQMRLAGRHTRLLCGTLGEDITALGAASLLLQDMLEYGGIS